MLHLIIILGFYIEMLFPLKTSEESNLKESENAQNTALMKANLLMDIYFEN